MGIAQKICITVSLFLCCLTGRTATLGMGVRLFTISDVGNASVTRIVQDRDRYVWVATEFGLVRFDGYRFREYQHHSAVAQSLPSSFITQVGFVNGRMILATSSGMARYDESADAFEEFRFPMSAKPRVSAIVEWNGRLVASTEGYGIFAERGSSLQMKPLHITKGQQKFVSAMAVDGKDALWTADHSSILRRFVKPNANDAEHYDVSPYGQPVEMLRIGNEMIVLCRNAILRFDYDNRTLRPLLIDAKRHFSCISHTSDGKVFVGTVGNGLFLLDGSTLTPYIVSSEVGSLNGEDIRCIFEDSDGDLWIGSYRRGVYFVNRRPSPFKIYDSKSGEIFTNIIPASVPNVESKSLLYCQTRSNLLLFDGHAALQTKKNVPNNMEGLYQDHKGRLWIGTDNNLYLYDAVSDRCRLYTSFQADMINVMADLPTSEANGRDLLFVSSYGKGLCVYDVSNSSKRQLDMNDTSRPSSNRLSNNWVSSLCYVSLPKNSTANGGRLWIGTTHGLNIYDVETDRFEHRVWMQTIVDYDITSLLQTRDGDVVIGTGSGLFMYSQQSDSIVRFSAQESELDAATITGLTTDADGNLWIASSAGVWLYDTTAKKFYAFKQAGDVSLKVFNNYRSIVCCADGNIAVAVDGRIVCFDPRQLRSRHKPSNTLKLTSMIVSGRRVSPTSHLTVSHSEGTVRMEFSLMDYANAEAVAYSYRINNGPWNVNALGDNVVTINQLSPGDISIDVKAGIDGDYGDVHSYVVTVTAPWYLTWWARTLFAFIAVAVVVVVTLAVRDRCRLGVLLTNVQALREKFSEALHKTYKVDDGSMQGNDEQFMTRVMASINTHFKDSDFSIDDLSTDVGASRAAVGRKMKELTGVSPSTFIRNLRLEQAKKLLTERKLSISQVAYECGFSSGPVFSKIFRHHYGLSPRSFVEQMDKE